tara:strand:- start:78 stop:515 length:438 start_codon:yes stop_codon:yes gene_type:complete
MSKITKGDLKYIVKECLIEILTEGLLSNNKPLRENKFRKQSKTNKKTLSKKNSSHLDNIVYGKNKKSKPNIKTNISNNNVLNEIFADTAQHTLQEQIAADSHRSRAAMTPTAGADTASKIVSSHSPEEIFGDAASKWSKLAFFDS